MRRIAPLLIALTLVATACGGTDEAGSGGSEGGLASIKLPTTELTEVTTGDTVTLDEIAAGAPVLAWFWAPH